MAGKPGAAGLGTVASDAVSSAVTGIAGGTAHGKAAQLTVGVLALQGGVREHLRMVEAAGARAVEVRKLADFQGADGLKIDGLVLPGGESSTMDRLLRLFEMQEPLREAISQGLPVFGTCAGLILLADRVLDPAPGQQSLGGLDVTVARNAFGNQLMSAEALFDAREAGVSGDGVDDNGNDGLVRGALIRAPRIEKVGDNARKIVEFNGSILGATSADAAPGSLGQITGISFHPELLDDAAFHRAFIKRIIAR